MEELLRALLQPPQRPGIARVIESGPATVVLFDDGTKSVVKCTRCGFCPFAREGVGAEDATRVCAIRGKRDREKAVLHAMLKRVWPGYLDELRAAVPDGD